MHVLDANLGCVDFAKPRDDVAQLRQKGGGGRRVCDGTQRTLTGPRPCARKPEPTRWPRSYSLSISASVKLARVGQGASERCGGGRGCTLVRRAAPGALGRPHP
eukprot:scaffold279697_cov32-Tisochrysis_lutea.AAC.2